ncbi:MAG: ABC transporter permease subunit [Ruminiclostridium sp.]|nr:ABC transporter permease subunit [Ruminiclostridium sp.]
MKKRVISLLCVFFWLVVWQAGAMALNQRILLVTPVDAAVKLIELIPSADFWKSVMFSAGRILSGFALGLMVGTGLAVFSGRYVFLRKLLSPFISVLKAVPVASFTILALIWVSSKNLSVLVTFLICVPIVYINMLEGIDSLDPKLKEMSTVFGIPPMRRFVGIYLSQLLPYFRSAAGLAIGLCWKSGAAAEVIGIPDGSIGEKLYQAKIYLETADLFAWTAVIIFVSWLCEKAFMSVIKLLVKRVEKM